MASTSYSGRATPSSGAGRPISTAGGPGAATSATGTSSTSLATKLPEFSPDSFPDPTQYHYLVNAQQQLFDIDLKGLLRKLEFNSKTDPVSSALDYARSVSELEERHKAELKGRLDNSLEIANLEAAKAEQERQEEERWKQEKWEEEEKQKQEKWEQEEKRKQEKSEEERQKQQSRQGEAEIKVDFANPPPEWVEEQKYILMRIQREQANQSRNGFSSTSTAKFNQASTSSTSSAGHSRTYSHSQAQPRASPQPQSVSRSGSIPLRPAMVQEEEESGHTTSGDSTSASESDDALLNNGPFTTSSSFVSPGSTPPTPGSMAPTSPRKPTPSATNAHSRSSTLDNSPPEPPPERRKSPSPYIFERSPNTYSYTSTTAPHRRTPTPPPAPPPPAPSKVPRNTPSPTRNTPQRAKAKPPSPISPGFLGRPRSRGATSPTSATQPTSPTYANWNDRTVSPERGRGKEEKPKETIYNPSPLEIFHGNWSPADWADIDPTRQSTLPSRRGSIGSTHSGGRRPSMSLFGDSPALNPRTNLGNVAGGANAGGSTLPRKPSPPNSTNAAAGASGGGSSSASGGGSGVTQHREQFQRDQQINSKPSGPSLSQQYWNAGQTGPWPPTGRPSSTNANTSSNATGSGSGSGTVPLSAAASFTSNSSSSTSGSSPAFSGASGTSATSATSTAPVPGSKPAYSSSSGYYVKTGPTISTSTSTSSIPMSATSGSSGSSTARLSTSPTSASGFPTGPPLSRSSTTSSTASMGNRPVPPRSQTMPAFTTAVPPSHSGPTTPSTARGSQDPFERLAREHYEQEAKFRSGVGAKSSYSSLKSASGAQGPSRSASMGTTAPPGGGTGTPASGGGFVPSPPPGMGPSASTSAKKPQPQPQTQKGPREYTDDDYAKAREEEEKFRARKLAASVASSSSSADPNIKARMAEAWVRYEEKWSALNSLNGIRFGDVPWPIFTSALVGPSPNASPYAALSAQLSASASSKANFPKPITGIEQLTTLTIASFVLSPHHSEGKSRKDRIKAELLRWHPDRFNGRFLEKVSDAIPLGGGESERERVKQCVGQVARCLSELKDAGALAD